MGRSSSQPQNTNTRTIQQGSKLLKSLCKLEGVAMAAQKVFDITELLEMTILHLGGYHDILVARAVCKQWQVVFDNSLAIKRVTFRAPGDPFAPGAKMPSEEVRKAWAVQEDWALDEDDENPPSNLDKVRELGCEYFTFHPKKRPYLREQNYR